MIFLISIAHTCVRPILEYCAPLFHHSLPEYLHVCNDIKHVQRCALSVIAPATSYHKNLSHFNLCTLKGRCSWLCEKLFTSIKLDKDHKLHTFFQKRICLCTISGSCTGLRILRLVQIVLRTRYFQQGPLIRF